jgi:hypothetical protein
MPLLVVAACLPFAGRFPRRLALAGALAAAFAVSAGPWIIRNEVVAGLPSVSSADSDSLLYNNAAGALAESEGVSVAQARDQLRARVRSGVPAHPSAGEQATVERSVAIDVIAHHLDGLAVSEVTGTARILFGTAEEATFDRLGRGHRDAVPRTVRTGIVGASLLLLALTYFGFVVGTADLFRTRRWPELAAVIVPVMYSILVAAGPVANGRFRVPVMPLLAVVAGGGVVVAKAKLRTRRELPDTLVASGGDARGDR